MAKVAAKTVSASLVILATTFLAACGGSTSSLPVSSSASSANTAVASGASATSSLSSSTTAKTTASTTATVSSSAINVPAGSVEVFAAASLNAAGAELEKTFESEHPGVDITFNYAGSSKLVQQMQQGATPDLLVTADTKTMGSALSSVSDLSGVKTKIVATNSLVLATSAGNPGKIKSVQDLAGDVTVAICAAEVPCGNLAHQELDKQKITLKKATEEQSVTDVATKVATSAVDAGFIYSTDAANIKKTQDITQIALPDLQRNEYPLALTKKGSTNATATAFDQWLTSAEAQKILASYGFGSAK